MGQLQRNTLANLIGRVWSKALGFVFIPLYIKFLGVEAFGLVGFYVTLQSVLGLFDFGISVTLNREIARLSALEGSEQEQRDLLRSLEIIYYSIALLMGMLIFWLSPFVAHHWVKPQALSVATVERGVALMGLAFLFQFPLNLYQFGLMGKERQVLLNTIQGVVATVQGVGAVFLLWLVSATIECFFLWQVIISILGTGVTAWALWHSLAASAARPRFRISLLRKVWRFAAGWLGIGVTHTITFHADRVVLSKLVPLDLFGYYTLAQTIAMALWALVESVTGAATPRFSQLVVLDDEGELKTTYHRTCQFLAVILMPVAVIMALFSWEIVMLWTRNRVIADTIHQVTSILIIGIMLRGIASIPFSLQVAYGWLRLALSTNVISAIIFVPLIVLMASRYGIIGTAAVTAVQHLVFLLSMLIMYGFFLKGEQGRWVRTDFLLPLTVVLLVAGVGRLLYPSLMPPLFSFAYLAVVWLITAGATAMMTPEVRVTILSRFLPKAGARID
jgi:O-antigen/teichoic acid export membrane protein